MLLGNNRLSADALGIISPSMIERRTKEGERIQKMLKKFTTAQERYQFVSKFNAVQRIGTSPKDMAFFYIGEDDFQHKNVSPNHQKFLDELVPWVEKKRAIKMTQQNAKNKNNAGNNAGNNANNSITTAGFNLNPTMVGLGTGIVVLLGTTAILLTNYYGTTTRS